MNDISRSRRYWAEREKSRTSTEPIAVRPTSQRIGTAAMTSIAPTVAQRTSVVPRSGWVTTSRAVAPTTIPSGSSSPIVRKPLGFSARKRAQ